MIIKIYMLFIYYQTHKSVLITEYHHCLAVHGYNK